MRIEYTTQSKIKCFKECQRKYKYTYIDRLKNLLNPEPPNLLKGSWLHDWLEAYYLHHDTEAINAHYKELVAATPSVLDQYPNIIRDMYTMQEAYAKHWERDDIKVLDTEFNIEGEFPSGVVFKGRADMLIENPDGTRWLVDHKTYKRAPHELDQVLDIQSALYTYFGNIAGLGVEGFVWNYIIWTPPGGVNFNINGSLSSRQPVQDYTTVLKALVETNKLDVHADLLERQRQLLYYPGNPLESKLFYRHYLTRPVGVLEKIVQEVDCVVNEMGDAGPVYPPNPGQSCAWCDYSSLCLAQSRGDDLTQVMQHYGTV